jgi:hypothetical protein
MPFNQLASCICCMALLGLCCVLPKVLPTVTWQDKKHKEDKTPISVGGVHHVLHTP